MELEIEKLLKEKRIEYRLIKLSQNARTVNDVINYSEKSLNPNEICKTIILKCKKSGKMIAILLKGNDKISFSKAKKILGEEIVIANEEQVKEAARAKPGAVCPFLLNVPLFIDERVFELKKLNCGSGDNMYGLELATKDLAIATNYNIVSLAKP